VKPKSALQSKLKGKKLILTLTTANTKAARMAFEGWKQGRFWLGVTPEGYPIFKFRDPNEKVEAL